MGQNDGDFGAILHGLCLLGDKKGIVGCNVMTIHNEAFLLITSGLWVKVLQCYSATVPKYISKGQKHTLYL